MSQRVLREALERIFYLHVYAAIPPVEALGRIEEEARQALHAQPEESPAEQIAYIAWRERNPAAGTNFRPSEEDGHRALVEGAERFIRNPTARPEEPQ